MSGRRIYFVSPTAFSGHWRGAVVGTGVSEPGSLFELPEYAEAFSEFIQRALQHLAEKQVPLLTQISMERVEFIRTAHVDTPAGGIEIPAAEASFSWVVDLREVLDFNVDAFSRRLDTLALQHADAQIDNLLRHVDTITTALGNTTDGKGQPLDWPILLTMLENFPLEFDKDGEPRLPIIVDDANRRVITPYPPLQDRDRQSFNELMRRKREEFDAGAHRQ